MREFQGTKQFRRHLYSFPTLIVLIIITFLLAVSVWGLYQKKQYAQVNLNEARARVAELEKRKAQLGAMVARLETPEGKEVEIRSRFPVALEGEKVLSIVGATDTPASNTDAEGNKTAWWQFWK